MFPEALPADWPCRTNVTLISSAAAAGIAAPTSSANAIRATPRNLPVPAHVRRLRPSRECASFMGYFLLPVV
jgi:hypothetical protein